MKKIFLASSFSDTAKLFASVNKNLEGKTVTFIPAASLVEKVTFYVSSGKKALEKLGLVVEELNIPTAPIGEIEKIIKKNDFIYITGGNTFFLLQELKRTGADEIVVNEVNSGKVYIGESAGAMILSKDLEYSKKLDSIKKAPNLKGFAALGLVDFYTVPHYNSAPFKKAAQNIIDNYEKFLDLSPISNKEAIWVEGEEIIKLAL